MIKIIVAGSRTFNDFALLVEKVGGYIDHAHFHEPLQIVSGGARGADTLGERYAREYGFDLKVFPAEWNKYGRSAGYIRNEEMAKYATHCFIFWDGESKGSKHMYDLALKYKLVTIVVKF